MVAVALIVVALAVLVVALVVMVALVVRVLTGISSGLVRFDTIHLAVLAVVRVRAITVAVLVVV